MKTKLTNKQFDNRLTRILNNTAPREVEMGTYLDYALYLGFEGDRSHMEHIGMAMENAGNAWDWFQNGDDKHNVAAIFEFRNEKPNEKDVYAAYIEGAATASQSY